MRIFIFPVFGLIIICGLAGTTAHAETPEPSEEYKQIYSSALQEFNAENYDKALTILEQTIAVDPQQTAAYNLSGAANVKLKKYEQAIDSFRKILSIKPESSIAMFNLGESLFLLKDYSQAKQYFQGYLNTEGNKTNALARYKVILCDLLGGNEAVARDAVQNLKPTISHPLEYYGRAAIQFHAGNEEEAREYLRSAFQIYPGGLNLAFADSLVELGWLKEGEVAQIGAVNAAALKSLSNEFQPEAEKDDSGTFREKFDSLLPSLGGADDEKDKE